MDTLRDAASATLLLGVARFLSAVVKTITEGGTAYVVITTDALTVKLPAAREFACRRRRTVLHGNEGPLAIVLETS